MDDFEREMKQGFLEEAAQLLGETEQCFLALENNPNDTATLEKIFRLAHNLKGSSKAVGFDSLGGFTHEFENLLLKLKKGELAFSTAIVSLLLKCNDHLNSTVATLSADITAVVDHTQIQQEVIDCVSGKTAAPTEGTSAESQPVDAEEPFTAGAIPADEVLLVQAVQAEVLASEASVPANAQEPMGASAHPPVSPGTSHSAAKAAPAKVDAGKGAVEESIRVSINRLEKLINFVGEMVILQTVLREQSQSPTQNMVLLRRTVDHLGKVGKEIQDISMSLRMMPVKQTFLKMQRIVRDTSNLLGKKVSLVLVGEETELDKTVLEAVSDPLVHLIRNAVDHGIEDNIDRIRSGKPEAGTVVLSAFHQGGKLVIEIKDDGGGINPDKLYNKAIEKGILKPGQVLTRDQKVNLIFAAGFSTKAQVTEVSGRGVGMDVVKTNVQALQGEIQVDTEVGKGSTFKIILPLTLAIIDGTVVTLEDNRFVIPLAHVHESYRPAANDVKRLTGLGEMLLLRGENLPLFRLSNILGWKRKKEINPEEGIALIIRGSGDPFAVLVDDIIGQYQVVIKKLGAENAHLKGFSGSAILGDGKPALILELTELIKTTDTGFKSDSMRRASA